MNKIAVLWPNQLQHRERISLPGVSLYEDAGVLNAPEIAARLKQEGFQAIVCTGGIEAAVRQVSDLPMYVVTSSYMDILESFRRLENEYGVIGETVALLVHESNRIQLSRIAPFVENRIQKFTFTDQASIPSVLRQIVESGFACIMTGPTGLAMTREQGIGIPAYSLIYSEESVLDAVEQVNKLIGMSRREIMRTQQVQAAIDASPYAIVATDHVGNIVLCNHRAAAIVPGQAPLMGQSVATAFHDPSWYHVYTEGITQQEVLMKLGGVSYFSSRTPIVQGNQIIGSVGTLQEVEQIRTMESKFRSLQTRGLTAAYHFGDIVYKSSLMEQAVRQANIYAQTNLTVLIEGETGTGKEMIAQSIHNASQRRDGPFVAINCAALAESLLESELMGYEEGAFTGAKKGGKAGLFELAHNGTLFLDEINQISPPLQGKLLRVIQERTVMRLGGSRMIPVNVRILAASNENLREKVRGGLFRSDLYYRISTLCVRLPPLRERREDILPLMEHFSRETEPTGLDLSELYRRVSDYDWPGNIRELENYVLRSGILHSHGVSLQSGLFQDCLQAEPGQVPGSDEISVHIGTLSHMERELVAAVLQRLGGNQSQAARLLGVSRNTVASKLR